MFKKIISLLTAVSMAAGMAAVPITAEEVSENAAVQYSEELNKEEQERAEAERRHEDERAKAEEEQAKAEQERREREKKRTEQRAAWGLTEPSERPTRPADGEVQLMAESEYSEVVYISTVEELLAIEGHSGGYYELKNDLNISGMEWSTLYLENATFNGGGHTINGMSITKEPGRKLIKTQRVDEEDGTVHEDERAVEIRDIGFFSGTGNYVYDLNLRDAKIDVTVTDMNRQGNISIIGEAYADTCKVYGSINVIGEYGNGNDNDVYGLNSGNNCEAEVSITAEYVGIVYGIESCPDSVFVGDITSNRYTYCISNSDNSTFEGDITAIGYVYGIYGSDNSTFEGDITANGYVWGIYGSSNSTFTGDITGNGDLGYIYGISSSDNSTFIGDIATYGFNRSVYGIVDSDNSTFEGDMTADHVDVISGSSNSVFKGNVSAVYSSKGIYDSDNSIFIGDITSYGEVYGIYGSNSSTFEGDITANKVDGIWNSDNSVFKGNVSAIEHLTGKLNGISDSRNSTFVGNIISGDEATGIKNSDNCTIIGNIIENGAVHEEYYACISDSVKCYIFGSVTVNSNDARGIRRSTDCGISGAITEYTERGSILTVSSRSPYQGEFECDFCDTITVSDKVLYYTVHCYSYHTHSDGTVEPVPRYYGKTAELLYDDNTVGEPPSAGEEPTAPPPQEEQPTSPPEDYMVQFIAEMSGNPLPYAKVTIGGTEYTTDANGVIMLTDAPVSGGLKVEFGGSVIYTDADFTAMPNRMNTVKVTPLKIAPEDFNLGTPSDGMIDGPKFKVLDKDMSVFTMPTNFEFNLLDAVKFAYDPDERSYKVIFGGSEADLKDIRDGEHTPAFIERYMDAMEFMEDAKNGDLNAAKFLEKNSTDPKKLGWNANVAISGFMELKLDDKNMWLTNGGITMVASMGMERSIPIPAAPYIYVTYSIKGSLETGIEVSLDNAEVVDPLFAVRGKLNFAVEPSVGAGVGIKKLASVETGLTGKLDVGVNFPFESLEKSFTAELSAEYYFLINFLLGEIPFKHTFIKKPLYPPGAAELMSAESDFIAELGADDLRPVSRDYLDRAVLAADDPDTFKENIYPYSSVKTAVLSDGRVIMVWLDDDAARTDENRTALYYSIKENGVWSAAEQINNDGTADFDFAIAAKNNKAAIVWQNANALMPEGASPGDTAVSIELSYAEFDGTAWGEPIRVTSGNKDYEYNPVLNYDSYGTAYTAWTKNPENSPMIGFDTTTESVYSASVKNGAVTQPELRYDSLPLIYETAISDNNHIACIADKDGNIETPESVLYIDGEAIVDNGTALTGLGYDSSTCYFTENGSIYQIQNNKPVIVSELDSGALNVRRVGSNALIYEVQNGFSSNLYASYYSGGWQKPVQITDFDEKIRSWDAYYDKNGNLEICAVLAKVNMEGSDAVRLVCTAEEPVEDIEVSYIDTEDELKRGKTATFTIGLTNNTRSKLTSLHAEITGDVSGSLYSGEVNVSIPAGESGKGEVRVTLPEDFTKQNVTVTVTNANITEKNADNNSASEVFGRADLSAKIKDSRVFTDGVAEIAVKNSGCEDAANVVVTLTGENGDTIYSENIGAMTAGESRKIRVTLDEKYYTFTDDFKDFLLTASVASDTEDAVSRNNEDKHRLKPQTVQMLRLDNSSVTLQPGSTYSARITPYPAIDGDVPMYYSSDNESAATVDENGVITAVGNGTAVISYMTPGALMTSKLTVYVHEVGAPEIVSAEYMAYGSEDYIYGYTEVAVNTSSCLAEGEKAQMITTVYDEDGTVMDINITEVTAEERVNVSISTYRKRPKRVKVMLWNSITGMKPAAYSAEREITAQQ